MRCIARFQLAVGNIMRQQMDSFFLLLLTCHVQEVSCSCVYHLSLGEDGLKTRERSKEERQKEREEKRKAKVHTLGHRGIS